MADSAFSATPIDDYRDPRLPSARDDIMPLAEAQTQQALANGGAFGPSGGFLSDLGEGARNWWDQIRQFPSSVATIGQAAFSRPADLGRAAYETGKDIVTAPFSAAKNILDTQAYEREKGLPITANTGDMLNVGMGASGLAAPLTAALPEQMNSLVMSVPKYVANEPKTSAALSGITAYHGTPADFNRFSNDYIGSGEGNQAQGYGHYFAENEAVAKSYRDALTKGRGYNFRGEPINYNPPFTDPLGTAKQTVATQIGLGIDPAKAIRSEAARWRNGALNSLRNAPEDAEHAAHLNEIADHIQSFKPTDFTKSPNGNGSLYTVSIDHQPEEFLDWDKPLSEQPHKDAVKTLASKYNYQSPGPNVSYGEMAKDYIQPLAKLLPRPFNNNIWAEKALHNDPKGFDVLGATQELAPQNIDAVKAILNKWQQRISPDQESGGDWYRGIVNSMPETPGESILAAAGKPVPASMQFTDELRKAGIAGIRYLDQGSRGNGNGTYNYVVFNPDKIRITHKNGVPISSPEEHAAAITELKGGDPYVSLAFTPHNQDRR